MVQVFVSLVLVLGSLILFGISAKQRDYEHADRLALLPIEADTGQQPPKKPSPNDVDAVNHPGELVG